MSFSEEETAYLRSQRLPRITTVSGGGRPDVVPVGFEFDGRYVYVGGIDPAKTISWSFNLEGLPFTHDREIMSGAPFIKPWPVDREHNHGEVT